MKKHLFIAFFALTVCFNTHAEDNLTFTLSGGGGDPIYIHDTIYAFTLSADSEGLFLKRITPFLKSNGFRKIEPPLLKDPKTEEQRSFRGMWFLGSFNRSPQFYLRITESAKKMPSTFTGLILPENKDNFRKLEQMSPEFISELKTAFEHN